MEIDITQFCELNAKNPDLVNPYQIYDYDAASNGHILIFRKSSGNYPPQMNDKYNNEAFKKIFSKIIGTQFNPAPAVALPASIPCSKCEGTTRAMVRGCEECEGMGEVIFSNSFNTYEHDCKTCDGKGEITVANTDGWCGICQGIGLGFSYDNKSVLVNKVKIQSIYWELIKQLPSLETANIEIQQVNGDKHHALAFRSGEYHGLVMPYGD